MINIVQELKEELRRVRHERDILHLIAVDMLQEKENITRAYAEEQVSQEVFTHLKGLRS